MRASERTDILCVVGRWACTLFAALLFAACASSDGELEGARTDPTTSHVETQAVIVHLSRSTYSEIGLSSITDPLEEAIATAGAGELQTPVTPDGALLIMAGPDADALWRVAEPILRDADLGPGAYAVLQYGPPGARETRIDIS